MKKYIYLFIGLIWIFTFSSCEDLEVENTNRPTFQETNDPTQINGLVGGFLNSCNVNSHYWDEPLTAIFMISDVGTCSWGNFGMRDLSSEPRVAFNNTPGYPNRIAFENYYINMYSTLSSANDALLAIASAEEGVVEEVERAKAISYYTQAYCLGHIGMFYDQGFIVTNYTDLTAEIPLVTYDVLIDSAVAILDKAIAICNSVFTIPADWLPANETYTNTEIAGLANTLAARLLTYKSRTAAQNESNDWSKILTYAQNGIQFDYAPIMNDIDWYDYHRWYIIRATWARIDMRTINMMDPNMYPWFPASGRHSDLPNNGLATSDDARLLSDFEYLDDNNFLEERGVYHYSSYRYKRYDNYRDTRIGRLPTILKWENDMIWAEALARTGNIAGAAAILNDPAGPRKVRGGLNNVPSSLDDVLKAIYYEKTIECMVTTENTEFYDMRRRDMLQAGTFLHLPIPAQQLEILGIPFYSYGGETGIPGEDYSTGGWETKPGYAKSDYGY